MRNRAIKRLITESLPEASDEARERAKHAALSVVSRRGDRIEKRRGSSGRPLKLAIAAAAVCAAALIVLFPLGTKKTADGGNRLVFLTARAELAEDGNTVIIAENSADGTTLPIKAKLAFASLSGVKNKDRNAALLKLRMNTKQSIDLMSNKTYNVSAQYGDGAFSISSDKIFTVRVGNCPSLVSLTVECGENGLFELSNWDNSHLRRYENSFRYGSKVVISGEEFDEMYRVGDEDQDVAIWWRPSKTGAELMEQTGEVSALQDVIRVTAKYADGAESVSCIRIGFDSDGWMKAALSDNGGNASFNGSELVSLPREESSERAYELASIHAALDEAKPELIGMEGCGNFIFDLFLFDDGSIAALTDDPSGSPGGRLLTFFDTGSGTKKNSIRFPSDVGIDGIKVYGSKLYVAEKEDNRRVIRSYSSGGKKLGEISPKETLDRNGNVIEYTWQTLFDSKYAILYYSETDPKMNMTVHTRGIDLTTGKQVRLPWGDARIRTMPQAVCGDVFLTCETANGAHELTLWRGVKRISTIEYNGLELIIPGKQLSSGVDRLYGRVELIDIEAGEENEFVFDTRGESSGKLYSSYDGKYLLSADFWNDTDQVGAKRNTFRLYDPKTEELILGFELPGADDDLLYITDLVIDEARGRLYIPVRTADASYWELAVIDINAAD